MLLPQNGGSIETFRDSSALLHYIQLIIRKDWMMKTLKQKLLIDEAGMTTAEYAVGTVAAAGFGSILLKILMSSEMRDLIARVIQQAFSFLFG